MSTTQKFLKMSPAAGVLYAELGRRLAAGPPGICPVDMALSIITVCHSQSCGKCTPCRIGLAQLKELYTDILEGRGDEHTMYLIEKTASAMSDSSDCAIGYGAADMVLASIHNFREDYEEHIARNRCLCGMMAPVPCVGLCPARVDVPGYIALVNAGRCADAIRLIRKDNPLPVACAYVCEHPCESHCRRNMVDDAINIRALKRFAVDMAGVVPEPPCAPATGKRIAVIGAGPGGLSAAYYLSLMGHKVTIYERRGKLGGMLRYGIPAYRFPRELLDRDIEAILSTGIEVKTGVDIGADESFSRIVEDYDAVFVTIGAHKGGSAHLPGEELEGVMSAVELLGGIGDGEWPDFTGKTVAIIGGGNVAMDVTRTAIRLGAANAYCVYRRRQIDMTAQPEEVEGAIAEGAEIVALKAPVRIEDDGTGKACALWVRPQIPGHVDASGRPSPVDALNPEERIAVDAVIVAVGQKTEAEPFIEAGMTLSRKGSFVAASNGQIKPGSKIFAGGECVTGPATVIRAIAAGKAAANGIDRFLGFRHEISVDVDIPTPSLENKPPRGRVSTTMRIAFERKCDFDCIEEGLTEEGAATESSRCLRCDYYGCGSFRGGREDKW